MLRGISFLYFLSLARVSLALDDNYEKLKAVMHASLEIQTSSSQDAETMNEIMATFIGDFSESGPHSLGEFSSPGSVQNRTVVFDRVIGQIREVLLSNRGTDGWLMADFKATMGDQIYLFEWQRQWLDTIDPLLLDLYGNGYEPFAQESLEQLPAKSTLLLTVSRVVPIISGSGVYRPVLATLAR